MFSGRNLVNDIYLVVSGNTMLVKYRTSQVEDASPTVTNHAIICISGSKVIQLKITTHSEFQ